MKKIIPVIIIALLMLCMVSCGGSKSGEEPKNIEIAMIADCSDIEDGSFTQETWTCIENFAKTEGITAGCIQTEEVVTAEEAAKQAAKEDKENKDGDKAKAEDKDKAEEKPAPATKEESYMRAIEQAVEKKAKLIVMAGSNFETTVYAAQAAYPEVYFLLIDGVPHDAALNYANGANTISILFAEEEAGYLAGYAAVKDGYTKLGFMGGQELPSVKRYGYGFVQGVAAAAAELEQKVELSYVYTGTFEPSEDVQKQAAEWYKGGTEVIFACGSNMGTSVMKAAENKGGKVIGVDVDQSYLSPSVITSAKKEIDTAVLEMLENYKEEKFVGGISFNYTAKNGGVSLEMDNGQFKTFKEDDYKKALRQIKNGKIQLKKDTGVSAVSELTGEWVKIK